MKTEMVDINSLVPYEKNPRINEAAILAVANSIKEHGFNQPIVVNHKNTICVGHTRWLAAQELGLKKVPVFKKKMTEIKFKTYNLADNKVAEYSQWDNELLAELMTEIQGVDDGALEDTGFTQDEIDALLDNDDLDELAGVEVEGHTRLPPGEKSHVKMVQIFLDDVTFPKFIEMCEVIQKYMTTDNLTDTVYNAVEKVHDEVRNQ